MDAISRLLQPRSVAVIGASADPTKTAGRPVAYLQKHGYAGQILPVNPKADRIGDLPCYPDIASLPVVPDVGIVLLGAERAHLAVRDLAARGTAAAIVLASGYAETGEDGARRQRQLIEAAGSMRILGPNTIGLVNLTDSIVLSATGALEMDHFPVGGIGVVSQSGGILGSLLSRAAARGIGLSKLISTSNEVDLELADFIDHLADDEATKVIALYVETRAQPAEVPRRCAEGGARGQAGRRLQDRPLGSRRRGRGVAHRRDGRRRPHVRRAVPPDRRDPRAELQRPARHPRRAGHRPQAARQPRRHPHLHRRRRHAGLATTSACTASTRRRPMPPRPQRCARCRPASEAVLDRNPIDVTLAGLRPDLLRGAITALLASPELRRADHHRRLVRAWRSPS